MLASHEKWTRLPEVRADMAVSGSPLAMKGGRPQITSVNLDRSQDDTPPYADSGVTRGSLCASTVSVCSRRNRS